MDNEDEVVVRKHAAGITAWSAERRGYLDCASRLRIGLEHKAPPYTLLFTERRGCLDCAWGSYTKRRPLNYANLHFNKARTGDPR